MSIHGHEVMNFIGQEERGVDITALTTWIETQFGDNCRFHTCSMEDMDLTQLLDFLVSRGKIAEQDGRLVLKMAPCDH